MWSGLAAGKVLRGWGHKRVTEIPTTAELDGISPHLHFGREVDKSDKSILQLEITGVGVEKLGIAFGRLEIERAVSEGV